MRCSEAMLSSIYSCGPQESVIACAARMRDGKVGFLPVLDGQGRPVGVVTDRDLALRVLAGDLPPTTCVGDVMSPGPLLTGSPDEELEQLEERMATLRCSRAILVDGLGCCVGVLSLSDVARRVSSERAGRLLQQVTMRESVQLIR